MPDYDAIVVGAGHNGLTAGMMLAKAGLKVLIVERTGWVGGMAATKELFKGFKHNVGAWALLVLPDEMHDILDFDKHGVEIITPRTSYCVFGAPEDTPFVAYADPNEMIQHLMTDHGPDALQGLMGLFEYLQVFGNVMAAERAKVPDSIDTIIAAAPDARTREILITCFYGSAMDVIRKFLPDPNRHRCIGGSLAAMTIDGTHKGPYSPGTACSMAYHYTVSGGANLFKMPKGGIGTVSEAILKSFEEHGGTVQYRADVQRLLVEKGRVVGVQLRSGETISSKVVLSSADARSTFIKLVGEEQLPTEFVQAVKEIEYTNGYIQLHLTLKELPEFTGHLAFANENNIRWLTSYIPSPEHLSRCWEQYRRNQVPDDPVSYCYIPSVMDPSLAPSGYHTCTMFSHYFPAELAPAQHDEMKKVMADRVIGQIAKYAPNFRDAIMDQAILTHEYFGSKFAITAGDFSHGLIHAGQMWHRRPVVGWANYRTPIADLYMCGSACHPGPGITALPGYNSAREVLKTWQG
ncbi:MAG TPA: NAD(P)/FAD-dependent oxidoreductase [Candidatus Binatia bacterium]